MATAKHFTELIAWQKSHKYVLNIYKTLKLFPANEDYGLASQLRRSSVSITSNIAEGFDRASNKDFAHFLIIARASLSESQNQLIVARDLGYITKADFEVLKEDSIVAHKIINSLIKSLKPTNLQSNKLKD